MKVSIIGSLSLRTAGVCAWLLSGALAMVAQTAAAEIPALSASEAEEACAADDANACVVLSVRYGHGRGLEHDAEMANELLDKAEALYLQACKDGDGAGCDRLTAMFMFSSEDQWRRIDRLAEEVLKTAEAVCSLDVPEACTLYAAAGEMTGALDLDEEQDILNRACKGGDARGCVLLFASLALTSRDYDEPGGWDQLAERSCDLGSFFGCQSLLNLEAEEFDYSAAGPSERAYQILQCMTEGCELGDAEACYFLAVSFKVGSPGLDASQQEAVRLYWRSCDLGNEAACEMAEVLSN